MKFESLDSGISNLSDLEDLFRSFLKIDVIDNQQATDGLNYPDILRHLYLIKDSYNKVEPSNSLFATQDYLISYPVQEDSGYIDVLEENQGCWVCSIDDKGLVYIRDGKNSKEYNRLDISLDEMLTTYALIELTFILPEIANEETDLFDGYSLDDLKSTFGDKLKPLWLDKLYVYPEGRYSFYQIPHDSLFFDGGVSFTFFATTDVEKYEMI